MLFRSRAAVPNEGLLHRMQLIAGRHALDRSNRCSFRLHRRDKAAVHNLAVEFDAARSALAFTATFFHAGQPRLVAQDIEQARHRIGVQRRRATIQREAHADLFYSIRHIHSQATHLELRESSARA